MGNEKNVLKDRFVESMANLYLILALNKSKEYKIISTLNIVFEKCNTLLVTPVKSEKFNMLLVEIVLVILNYLAHHKIDIREEIFDKALDGKF